MLCAAKCSTPSALASTEPGERGHPLRKFHALFVSLSRVDEHTYFSDFFLPKHYTTKDGGVSSYFDTELLVH